IKPTYDLFPIQYDSDNNGPKLKPNIFKAKFTIYVDQRNLVGPAWDGVRVTLQYGAQSDSYHDYPFVGTGEYDSARKLYKNEIEVNLADFDGDFSWEQGKAKVKVK